MTRTAPPWPLACMISAKNLGDAAGHGTVLAELAARGFAERFLVWTKPGMAFLFADVPRCEVVASPLPLGTGDRAGWRDAPAILAAAGEIRRRCPTVTLDLVGDQRERWLARLAGSREHLQIGWAEGHPFRRLIRNPFGDGRPVVRVPAEVVNVYDAYRLFVDRLAPRLDPRPAPAPARTASPEAVRAGAGSSIGLHPFASQACKLWPDAHWVALAGRLAEEGHRLTAFGAPHEADRLAALFAPVAGQLRIVAGTLPAFQAAVASLDLMIGLDSFSVHLAEKVGTRSVMLNAGNPPALWAPPHGRVIGAGGGCPHHPCYNVPRCEPRAPFVCIRATGVDEVLREVARMLANPNRS